MGPVNSGPFFLLNTIQLYNITTLQLYNFTTIQLYNITTLQLYNYSTIQHYNFTTMTNDTPKPKRIAIQGGYGAFHEIAAYRYFENEKSKLCPGIRSRIFLKP